MGAFNVVKATVECPRCRASGEIRVQFKFGDTWQHEYEIGDNLQWGGNDNGEPGMARVVADGASEGGPHCGHQGDFEVWIEQDQLMKVCPPSGAVDFVMARESYVVLER